MRWSHDSNLEVVVRSAVSVAAAVVMVALALTLVIADRDVAIAEPPIIGVLRSVAVSEQSQINFEDALRRAGFVPGRDVTIVGGDPAEIQRDPDQVRALLRSWEDAGVDLLVTLGTEWSQLALEVTALPVVFVASAPASAGLLDAPRATGVNFAASSERTLDILRLILPDADVVGILLAADDATTPEGAERIRAAARRSELVVTEASFGSAAEVDDAVRRLAAEGADAIVVTQAPRAIAVQGEIVAAAQALGLPLVTQARAIAPTLLGVYPDFDVVAEQVGRQAALVLGGLAPADVPVEEPRRHGMRVDRDRARALGIGLPLDVLRIATEVVG